MDIIQECPDGIFPSCLWNDSFISIEKDDDQKITTSKTESVTYTTNFKNNISFGDIVKIGLGQDGSTSQTNSTVLTKETTKTSDELGSQILYFYDAVMVEVDAKKGYRPKNVSNGAVTITMCAMSDSFTRNHN